MMIKELKRGVVLGLTAVVLLTGIPVHTAKAADVAPLHTNVTVSGKDKKQTVTYDLSFDAITVTDGRVAVKYDADVLELTAASDKVNYDFEDLNKDFVDEDGKGVSFAFVNGKARNRSGKVLHVKFAVKDWNKAYDTVIKTEVFGLNNDEEEVVSATVIEDAFTVGRNKPVTPKDVTAVEELGGVRIKWAKDENADGYIVYRATSEDGKYTKVGTTKSDSMLNLFVSKNKDYYYKVVAYQDGQPTYYSEESAPVKVTVTKILGIF
jgi:hypothetical protein